ncbi:hypothetical protein D3C81_2199470 [compost metagenome]
MAQCLASRAGDGVAGHAIESGLVSHRLGQQQYIGVVQGYPDDNAIFAPDDAVADIQRAGV